MGIYEYVLIAGAVVALIFGFMRVARFIAYPVFVAVGAWPSYTLGAENGWNFATVAIMTLIVFVVYAALHWVAARFSPRRA